MGGISENIDRESWQPVKVAGGKDASQKILKFIENHPGISIIDQYSRNLEELFLLRNPQYRFDRNYQPQFEKFTVEHSESRPLEQFGVWYYFPWVNQIVHYFDEDLHQELRTGRNKYLITSEEQKKYYEAKIGIAGLSVGSHVALTICMTGGAKHMRLADPDMLSGDNLNRIRTGFQNVGVNKAVAVARQIYEINPYADLKIYTSGITEENANEFLDGLDVFIEEMDNPYLKVKTRFLARELGTPVIMAADNGDGIIADVERYDLDKKYPILHGIINEATLQKLKDFPPQELPRIMAKIAGANIADLRMLYSVTEVGKSLYSWPQLWTADTMCGSVLAFLARRVALRDPKIKSGRYEVNPNAVFEDGFLSPESANTRESERKEYLRRIGI